MPKNSMDEPNQILQEDLNQTKTLTGSIGLFDLNILPQRYRRKRIKLAVVGMWLLFLVLLGLLYPSGIMALKAQAFFNQSKIELAQVQTTLDSYQSVANELEELEAEIEGMYQFRDEIIESYQGIDFQSTKWSGTLFLVDENAPEGITWTLISQQGNEIRLDGVSQNYSTILELVDILQNLDEIQSVQIDTIDQVIIEESGAVMPEGGEDTQALPTPYSSYTFTILAYTSGEEGLP